MLVGDNSNVEFVNVYHLYKGNKRKFSYIGDYLRVSVRVCFVHDQIRLKKKDKLKAIIVRTKKNSSKNDGSYISFSTNSVVLLKKRLTPYAQDILGPTLKKIKKKKFLSSFPGVF